MPKCSSCDQCHSRRVMVVPTTNEMIRRCSHPEFDKPRRIVSGLEIPKWCPINATELDLENDSI